jgi:microcystin-dependent protein
MTIAIKHAFVSLKGDGTDATQVQPSNWNASHSTSMATGNLLGRLSAGVGVFEEIPISAYMAALLTAADQPTLAGLLGLFETGDIKYTFKTTASTGWLLLTGGSARTIGSATSGATLRANADTLNLYTIIWNGCVDAIAPVTGGRGANAAADFAANKPIQLPNLVDRSPIGAGAATAGLTARVLGTEYGEEGHALSTNELAAHRHSVVLTDPGHVHGFSVPGTLIGPGVNVGGGGSFFGPATTNANTNLAATSITIHAVDGTPNATDPVGAGVPHNTIHPVLAMNVMVKL